MYQLLVSVHLLARALRCPDSAAGSAAMVASPPPSTRSSSSVPPPSRSSWWPGPPRRTRSPTCSTAWSTASSSRCPDAPPARGRRRAGHRRAGPPPPGGRRPRAGRAPARVGGPRCGLGHTRRPRGGTGRRGRPAPEAPLEAAWASGGLDPDRLDVTVSGRDGPGSRVRVTVRYTIATSMPLVGKLVVDRVGAVDRYDARGGGMTVISARFGRSRVFHASTSRAPARHDRITPPMR